MRKFAILTLLISGLAGALAQEISVPDPGLNAAIRDALHKPAGPLTQQDMLSLTNLNARQRNVRSVAGLEAAHNLASLDLSINLLTNFALPATLTKLVSLDGSVNGLTNCFIPNGMTNLASLILEGNSLRNLSLPADLRGLRNLDLEINELTSFNSLSNLTGLVSLNLGFNLFASFSMPAGLTNLSTFYFAGNPLTDVLFPPGLGGMTDLNLSQNLLTSFTLPVGMTNLLELDFSFNQLTNLSLPADLRNLEKLDLDFNRFTRLSFPSNLTSLNLLQLRSNLFTSFSVPPGLTALTYLDLSDSPLTNLVLPSTLNHLATLRLSGDRLTTFTLPRGLTNLTWLSLANNALTNLVLPPDLFHLESLILGGNQLTNLNLPSGLANLTELILTANQLSSLTLPQDMTQLVALAFQANPLTTLVLSESLAASTNLLVNLQPLAELPSTEVSVYTYPLTVELVRSRMFTGRFQFGITGPPGVYAVLGSTNLAVWDVVGTASNPLGSISFNDVTVNLSPHKFYRALLQGPPTNMVFISPNTFVMGSPTNDLDRSTDESPQTTVTLTRGFWIGKYEVTQGEYLAVTGTNPSDFPGDLSRPISTVSWTDATNYCGLLTQRELAAGHISPGTRYRLPTEAEWECAARAGTSTRFSYGDDPNYLSTTNYAWFLDLGKPDLTVHSVGQKLPNPWGLYDVHGNVWEWCQDNYGPLPGGIQIDPTGPPSSLLRDKVARGGAYDYPNSSCRSASRLFRFPLWPDSDVGFRVVLANDP